jgi:hypothetical protein
MRESIDWTPTLKGRASPRVVQVALCNLCGMTDPKIDPERKKDPE